jgi:hypothetical protein
MEISLPCNSQHDVECSETRILDWGAHVKISFSLILPHIDSGVGFDEWFFRAAVAEMFLTDFRDVLVQHIQLI